MSFDGSDKTIFRQSSQSDNTVMRPTPGGGRRHAQSAQVYTSSNNQSPQDVVRTPQEFSRPIHQHPISAQNPLIAAAFVLLTIIEKIRYAHSHSDVAGLYQHLVVEIKAYEDRARRAGIKNEIVLASRYLICTALDEAILNTPWGGHSQWPQKTLLSTFHNETAGGEKFFVILDKLRASPREYLDILELAYLCLSFGFEGKYKFSSRGRDAVEQIRDELFEVIRSQRGEYERTLSPHWQGVGRAHDTLSNYIPVWVILVSFVVLSLLIYSGFEYSLYHSSEPEIRQLMEISKP